MIILDSPNKINNCFILNHVIIEKGQMRLIFCLFQNHASYDLFLLSKINKNFWKYFPYILCQYEIILFIIFFHILNVPIRILFPYSILDYGHNHVKPT